MFKYHKKYVVSLLLYYPIWLSFMAQLHAIYFNRIRVGYNDAYRILGSISRFMSANKGLCRDR